VFKHEEQEVIILKRRLRILCAWQPELLKNVTANAPNRYKDVIDLNCVIEQLQQLQKDIENEKK
jgi:hypothetical protein